MPIREYLLGWIFAMIKKQYGLALEIADKGYIKFNHTIFSRMMDDTLSTIKNNFAEKLLKPTFKRRLINFLERL